MLAYRVAPLAVAQAAKVSAQGWPAVPQEPAEAMLPMHCAFHKEKIMDWEEWRTFMDDYDEEYNANKGCGGFAIAIIFGIVCWCLFLWWLL